MFRFTMTIHSLLLSCLCLFGVLCSFQLHLTGTSLSTEWKELLNAIHGNFVPFKTISYVPTPTSFVARHMPALQSIAEGLGLPQVSNTKNNGFTRLTTLVL